MRIKKITIDGLWGKYSLNWQVNSDVSILSGINGSGKSTVLRAVVSLLKGESIEPPMDKRFRRLTIELADETKLMLEIIPLTADEAEKNKEKISQILSVIRNGEKVNVDKVLPIANTSFISTFDYAPSVKRTPNSMLDYLLRNILSSDLDRFLNNVVERYKSYQIELSNKMSNMMTSGETNPEVIRELFGTKNIFLDVLDSMFKECGKRINRDKGDVEFIFESDGKSHPYIDLSAGEKQLLMILLTVFMQGGEEAILIMD
ncbi:MAG: hypothetical protein K2J63_09595, partial [Muribaculaceae bacterium]|nr:hypothetical protein [Muribaculaceae bacterium]